MVPLRDTTTFFYHTCAQTPRALPYLYAFAFTTAVPVTPLLRMHCHPYHRNAYLLPPYHNAITPLRFRFHYSAVTTLVLTYHPLPRAYAGLTGDVRTFFCCALPVLPAFLLPYVGTSSFIPLSGCSDSGSSCLCCCTAFCITLCFLPFNARSSPCALLVLPFTFLCLVPLPAARLLPLPAVWFAYYYYLTRILNNIFILAHLTVPLYCAVHTTTHACLLVLILYTGPHFPTRVGSPLLPRIPSTPTSTLYILLPA